MIILGRRKQLSIPDVAGWAERHAHLFLIGPAVLVMFALIGFPLIYTVYMSLHDWFISSTQPPQFIGLQNFVQALSAVQFRDAVLRTLYYTVLAVLMPTVFGLVAALVFAQPFLGRGALRTIFVLPMMATPAAMALIWEMMFNPTLGVLNYLLSLVGLPPNLWIFSTQTVIPSLVLVETWNTTPFMMLIILGGLAALPPELFEAATVDGASAIQKFRYLTLPLVWPFMMVAILLRTIDALKAFDTIYVLTQGGPGGASETINIFLYLQAFAYYHIGYASAVVLLLFLLVIVASVVLIRVRRSTSWQYY
jgi:multiple sugar transport system permease protein